MPAGLDGFQQAAADDIDRSRQKLLQHLVRQIVALANRDRQHAVLAGALDQRGIPGLREQRPRIRRSAPDDVAIATAQDDVGQIG